MGTITFGAMATLPALEGWFRGAGRVLLGYSGGVDSALLASVGARTLGPARFLAVLGRSASLAAGQAEQARAIARAAGVPLLELDTHELDDPQYRANAPDRCFHCKTELWSRLGALAAERGFDVVIDGTHADDAGEHRPGLAAAARAGVRSPLAELGWTKAEIRRAARELGLAVWDAPAAPCLASRVQYGLEVTAPRLRQVEQAEAVVRALGVAGDLRVRHLGALARIEVLPAEQGMVQAAWPRVERALLALGFERVELDPRGYRRGSLLPVAAATAAAG